jgi:hypothetical protein
MTHFQIAERLVAGLDAVDPVAFVGVEHLVFHGKAATSRPTAGAPARFSLSAASVQKTTFSDDRR